MLTREHRQESLTRAYILAIAARMGMSCSIRDFDYGIDLTLHQVTTRTNPATGRKRYIESGMPLDIQVKSTTAAIVEDNEVKYDLDVQSYDDLRDTNVRTPRILVLHVQPKDEDERLSQLEHALAVGGCCYWISLRGSAPVQNQRSKRISIPRKNIFSTDQLKQILEDTNMGGSW